MTDGWHADLRLERMVHGGRALARLDGGRVALVRGGLPGERVRAHLARVAGVPQGEVTEVLEASADRVPAPAHPGLDLGFVAYPRQLELKAEVLRDAAGRAGAALPGAVVVRPSPATWGYRSAVQPAVVYGAPAGRARRSIRLGYRRPGGHEVVPLAEDATANAGVRAAWRVLVETGLPPGVEEVALRGREDGGALAALVTRAPARDLLDAGHALVRAGLAGVAVAPFDPRGRFRKGKQRLAGARELRERFGRFELSVSATAFAQPNAAAAGQLYAALEALAPGGDRALDLYAGSAPIGLHLAAHYDEVVAIELSKESASRGARDARRLGIDNLTVRRGDARSADLRDADTVAVDPPRAGLSGGLRAALASAGVPHLLYASCDVATWARDAADLQARGYALVALEAFDFAPHTHHLELLSRFDRVS